MLSTSTTNTSFIGSNHGACGNVVPPVSDGLLRVSISSVATHSRTQTTLNSCGQIFDFMEIEMAGHSGLCVRPGVEVGLVTDLVMDQPACFRLGQPFQTIRFVIQQEDQPGMEPGHLRNAGMGFSGVSNWQAKRVGANSSGSA